VNRGGKEIDKNRRVGLVGVSDLPRKPGEREKSRKRIRLIKSDK
jgi:hypothetical protein